MLWRTYLNLFIRFVVLGQLLVGASFHDRGGERVLAVHGGEHNKQTETTRAKDVAVYSKRLRCHYANGRCSFQFSLRVCEELRKETTFLMYIIIRRSEPSSELVHFFVRFGLLADCSKSTEPCYQLLLSPTVRIFETFSISSEHDRMQGRVRMSW